MISARSREDWQAGFSTALWFHLIPIWILHASGGIASKAGGLFGALEYSSVTDCYSSGNVRASSIDYTAPTTPVRLMAGGIAGYADESSVSSSAGFCGSVAAEGENLKVASLQTYAARIAGMSNDTSYDNVYGSEENDFDG